MNSRLSFLFFFLLLTIFFSCENSIEKINLVTHEDNFPSEYSENIELIYTDSAVKKFKLNAPVLQRFIGDSIYTEFPKGVKVIIYDEEDEANSELTANYAINYETQDKLEAKNDVIIVNKFGEKLNTEHLWWDKKTSKIYSDAFVKITTKEEIIFGDGLEANQDFTQYKIKNIKGTIQVKDDEQVQ